MIETMLLNEFHGHASAEIDAEPAEVFAEITAIDHLPEWNKRVARVTYSSEIPLGEGVEWTVQMSVPPGAKWPSRSRVLRYNSDDFNFEYVSQTDDGNPSFVIWRWEIARVPNGSQVHVAWDAHPKTFWRKLLFAKLRRRQLPSEVLASLHALAYRLAPAEIAR
jgi:hypothetical protein